MRTLEQKPELIHKYHQLCAQRDEVKNRIENGEQPGDRRSYTHLQQHLIFCANINKRCERSIRAYSPTPGDQEEKQENQEIEDVSVLMEEFSNQVIYAQEAIDRLLASFPPTNNKGCQTDAHEPDGKLYRMLQKDHKALLEMLSKEKRSHCDLSQHVRDLESKIARLKEKLAEENTNNQNLNRCIVEMQDVIQEQKQAARNHVLHLEHELSREQEQNPENAVKPERPLSRDVNEDDEDERETKRMRLEDGTSEQNASGVEATEQTGSGVEATEQSASGVEATEQSGSGVEATEQSASGTEANGPATNLQLHTQRTHTPGCKLFPLLR